MESQCAGTFDYLPIHDFMMGGSIDKIYYSATFPIVINLCCPQERTLKALNYYSLMQYVNDSKREDNQLYTISFFFFFIYVGCPGQLTRTTTIPHSPLDILQAQEQVKHRRGDKHAHRESNPKWKRNKSHNWRARPSSAVVYNLANAVSSCLQKQVSVGK